MRGYFTNWLLFKIFGYITLLWKPVYVSLCQFMSVYVVYLSSKTHFWTKSNINWHKLSGKLSFKNNIFTWTEKNSHKLENTGFHLRFTVFLTFYGSQFMSVYVSLCQFMSVYVSLCQFMSLLCHLTSVYVSLCQFMWFIWALNSSMNKIKHKLT